MSYRTYQLFSDSNNHIYNLQFLLSLSPLQHVLKVNQCPNVFVYEIFNGKEDIQRNR